MEVLNNTLLNNQEITEEIKEEIKQYLETNDNENMMTQNLQDAAKAVQQGERRQRREIENLNDQHH